MANHSPLMVGDLFFTIRVAISLRLAACVPLSLECEALLTIPRRSGAKCRALPWEFHCGVLRTFLANKNKRSMAISTIIAFWR